MGAKEKFGSKQQSTFSSMSQRGEELEFVLSVEEW